MVALWSMSPVTLSRSGKLRHVLKKSLWNDHDIAGLKSHVARNVTVSYQIREMNRVGILLAVNGANDNGVISCGVSGKTPTAIIASSTVISARYGSERGWAASPIIRAWSGIGPTKFSTMTVTRGSLMYFASRCSYSRARAVGVLPIATTSSTSGIETRPSGRTGTVTVNSGLRQTKMFRLSPGPMRYSADGNEEAGGAGGNSGAPPHPASVTTVVANKTPNKMRCTFCPHPAFPTRINTFRGKCLPPKL